MSIIQSTPPINRLIDSMLDNDKWDLHVERRQYGNGYRYKLFRTVGGRESISYSDCHSIFSFSVNAATNFESIDLNIFQGLRAYWFFKRRIHRYIKAQKAARQEDTLNFLRGIGE